MENKVELVGYYGGDETIALAAWTSTSRNLTPDKKERIPKMINDLWSNGHKTPFERGIVHFLVNCDIASHIHLIKHRHAGTNGESARYKELKEDKIYLPKDWKNVPITGPTGNESIYFDDDNSANNWYEVLEIATKQMNSLYHRALKDVEQVLGRKRAKESARYFKTYNSQIETDVIMNMSCFANFLSLRKKANAQDEIHEIADRMLELVKNIDGNPFEYTIKAFGYKEEQFPMTAKALNL
jgi:flavin-dependent thymidylate synthase